MPVPSDLTESSVPGAQPVSARLSNVGVMKAKANHAWFYVFYPDHPGNWFAGTIDAADGVPDEDVGTWWLPLLQTESVQPGINNHKTLKTGMAPEAAYDTAHTLIRRDGGILLPHSLGYIREVACVDPLTNRTGVRHIDVWSTPRKTVQRGQRQKFDFDRQRYYRWLLALMRDGTLPLPDTEILVPRLAQVAERIHRMEAQFYPTPEQKATVLDAAKSEAARTESAKIPEPEAPKPRARRGRGES